MNKVQTTINRKGNCSFARGCKTYIVVLLLCNCVASENPVPNLDLSFIIDSSVIIPYYATDSQLLKAGYKKVSVSMVEQYVKQDSSTRKTSCQKENELTFDYYFNRTTVNKKAESTYLIYSKGKLKTSIGDTISKKDQYIYMLYLIDFREDKGFKKFCELNNAVYDTTGDAWRINRLRLRHLSNTKKQLSPLFIKMIPDSIKSVIVNSKYLCTFY